MPLLWGPGLLVTPWKVGTRIITPNGGWDLTMKYVPFRILCKYGLMPLNGVLRVASIGGVKNVQE